jgi:hypothetical protein
MLQRLFEIIFMFEKKHRPRTSTDNSVAAALQLQLQHLFDLIAFDPRRSARPSANYAAMLQPQRAVSAATIAVRACDASVTPLGRAYHLLTYFPIPRPRERYPHVRPVVLRPPGCERTPPRPRWLVRAPEA